MADCTEGNIFLIEVKELQDTEALHFYRLQLRQPEFSPLFPCDARREIKREETLLATTQLGIQEEDLKTIIFRKPDGEVIRLAMSQASKDRVGDVFSHGMQLQEELRRLSNELDQKSQANRKAGIDLRYKSQQNPQLLVLLSLAATTIVTQACLLAGYPLAESFLFAIFCVIALVVQSQHKALFKSKSKS